MTGEYVTKQGVTRSEAVKMGKAIAAANSSYTFRASECGITVIDSDCAHLVPWKGAQRGADGFYTTGTFFVVFKVLSSGKRTRAQIADGVPITYWIERPERHWQEVR